MPRPRDLGVAEAVDDPPRARAAPPRARAVRRAVRALAATGPHAERVFAFARGDDGRRGRAATRPGRSPRPRSTCRRCVARRADRSHARRWPGRARRAVAKFPIALLVAGQRFTSTQLTGGSSPWLASGLEASSTSPSGVAAGPSPRFAISASRRARRRAGRRCGARGSPAGRGSRSSGNLRRAAIRSRYHATCSRGGSRRQLVPVEHALRVAGRSDRRGRRGRARRARRARPSRTAARSSWDVRSAK